MRMRSLGTAAGVLVVAMLSAGPIWAQASGQAKPDDTNPRTARFGVWDNSTNPNNVMTYEAYEKDGSKLTVSNPSNPAGAPTIVAFTGAVNFDLARSARLAIGALIDAGIEIKPSPDAKRIPGLLLRGFQNFPLV